MENFVKGFRLRYTKVPEELYGRHAIPILPNVDPDSSGAKVVAQKLAPKPPTHEILPSLPAKNQVPDVTGDSRPKIKISLRRGNGTDWIQSANHTETNTPGIPASGSASGSVRTQDVADLSTRPVSETSTNVAASVAENVGTFLSGIRATFRQENTYVMTKLQSKKSNIENAK